MNERVLLLAKQVWPDPNISHGNHLKFADLIIQECLLALEPNSYDTEISYDVETKFYLRSAGKIKQHFGVEE